MKHLALILLIFTSRCFAMLNGSATVSPDAPFSKGPPKPDPRPPGRKSGDDYGTKPSFHRRSSRRAAA